MAISESMSNQRPIAMSTYDLGLYAATVFAWGFSWIAMKGQVGAVPAEVSVFWRFVLAALVMVAWSRFRGVSLSFPAKTHIWFAALGALIFSTNFVLFYYGAAYLASGMLAVVFSTASLFNLFLGCVLLGQRLKPVTLIAGLLGFSGIALIFLPKIMGTSMNTEVAIGLGLCLAGTLSFCLGNIVSASTQKSGVGVTPATTWGMIYAALLLGLYCLMTGRSFAIEMSGSYVGTLIYLAVVSSVFAFGAYLTLLGRIGAARAGYATVLFPLVALTVSTIFEGYVWTPSAILGVVCVLGGNALMLRRK